MWWRAASAAKEANCLAAWDFLPVWKQAWIIATIETKIDIANSMIDK